MQQSSMTTCRSESIPNREQEEIEQKLIEALQSPSVPAGKDFWSQLRRMAHERTQNSSQPGEVEAKE
jgi:hypothetical protein